MTFFISLEELFKVIEDPRKINLALAASGPLPLRLAFESDGTVKKIIDLREEAGEFLINRLKGYRKEELSDISLACYAYIIEEIGYTKSLSLLGEILDILLKAKETVFSQHFITHTIKVFTKQPELDTVNFSYSNPDIEKTFKILKAHLEKEGGD